MSVEDPGDAPKVHNVEIQLKQGQRLSVVADRAAENIGSLAAAGAAAGAVLSIAVSSTSIGLLLPAIGTGALVGGGVGYAMNLLTAKRRAMSEPR